MAAAIAALAGAGLWLALGGQPPGWLRGGPSMGTGGGPAALTAGMIDVPMPQDFSRISDEARPLIQHAAEQCRAEPAAECFAHLGRMYHGNGLGLPAIGAYEIALDLGADDPQTPYLLGLLQFEAGAMDDAARSFRTAIRREPTYPPAHHQLGQVLLQRGEIERAIRAFRRALALDDGDPLYSVSLAAALRQAGRLDEAESSLRRALSLDEDFAPAHQLLALTLHAQGRGDEAAGHLDRLRHYNSPVTNDPWVWEAYEHAASVQIHLDWARTYLEFGRIDSALQLLDTLSLRHPDHAGVFRLLGRASLAAGLREQAAGAFARAVEIEPGDAASLSALAGLFFDAGAIDKAGHFASLALRADPDRAEAAALQGAVALHHGRAEEAAERLEHALAQRPALPRAWIALGEAHLALGRFRDAADCFATAAEQRPDAAHPQRMLGIALMELGDLAAAKDALETAAALDPDCAETREHLTAVRQRLARD